MDVYIQQLTEHLLWLHALLHAFRTAYGWGVEENECGFQSWVLSISSWVSPGQVPDLSEHQ